MKFAHTAIFALACTALAATTNSHTQVVKLDGIEGSIQNSRQVMDGLTHALRSHDGHAVADVLVSFITGADSQIDNAVATITNALSPLTFGLSKAVGNFLLGPFVQAVTNGAEVMLANLVAMPFDGVNDAVINSVKNYQKSVSRLSNLASKHQVDNVTHLHSLDTKLTSFLSSAQQHSKPLERKPHH